MDIVTCRFCGFTSTLRGNRCGACRMPQDHVLPGEKNAPKRFDFVGTIADGASGTEAARRMEQLVEDVDPEFHVNVFGGEKSGQMMTGSVTKEAYQILFGPILYDGHQWRLAGRPEIHPKLEGMVTSAGPDREVSIA